MKISLKQYAVLLYEITRDASKKGLSERTREFLNLVIKRRALHLLPRILHLYRAHYNAQEQVVDAEVTTAREFGKKVLAEIGKQVSNDVELKVCEDPAVLGGARIRVGDWMVDDTLKERLKKLRHELSS